MANKNDFKNDGTKLSIKERILSVLGKGVSASKKGIKSAGNAISDFGDKSVLRIENSQIKSRIEKKYTQIGSYVYSLLAQKKSILISSSDETLKALVADINELFSQVSDNEDSIKAVDEKRKQEKSDASEKTVVKTVAAKPAVKTSAAKKAPAKKEASAKTAAAKTVGTKTTAKTATPKTATAKKEAAAKTAAKPAAKKTSAKTAAAKTTAAKAPAKTAAKTTAKTAAKAPAKTTAAKKTAASKKVSGGTKK